MANIKTDLRSLWYKLTNGTNYTLFDTKNTGMSEITRNRISDTTAVYGKDVNGVFVPVLEIQATPGDFDSFSLMFHEVVEQIHFLLKRMEDQRRFFLQRRTYDCPPTNTVLWKQLEHFSLVVSGGTQGAGPMRDGSAAGVESTITLKATERAHLVKATLSSLTTTEAEDILSVAGLGLASDCLPGYPGGDRILFFGADDDSAAAPGNLLYSTNGGGTIAAVGTDATPFTEVSGLNNIVIGVIDDTQIRVIVSRETDAGAKAKFAYQDFPFAGATMTAASWNVVTIANTSNGDLVERMLWFQDIGRLYLGAAGDIYLNTDDGVSDPGAAKFTGANAIAQFAIDPDNNVWAVAAANSILRELSSNRDTFAARTGPSGGGAFTAIAFAADGTLFAGNGTSIFKSTNAAADTAGWTSLKDFGASHVVKKIQVKNGINQLLRVVVDDTTPGPGEVWESEDGGNTWREITALSNNDGYNDAYFLPTDYNNAVLVGDDDATTGVIELLS